jgi:triosephosphate isomerase
MYKTPEQSAQYFRDWPAATSSDLKCELVLFVPAYNLVAVSQAISDLQKITRADNFFFGSQNHHAAREGAYTGESSPYVVKELGARYALVGHSERRTLFHESDDNTADKVVAALDAGLIPMLCVGETLLERQANKTQEVVARQLQAGLSKLKTVASTPVVIAYEPVWAIGTGQVATPEQAEEVHTFIRQQLAKMVSADFSKEISILYGGSVKPDNAAGLAAKSNIDGFLVGGASLKATDFSNIARSLG